MAKFSNPFGKGNELYITQTTHGSSNTAIDCYGAKYKPNLPVYAIASGKVGNYYSAGGSYITQYPDNSDLRIWYVHVWHCVPNGSYVKKGQKIGEIAPKSVNGGYPEHLHLGLTPKGENIMNYFDRSIPFRTAYSDIFSSWFTKSGDIDWRHFKDLSYDGSTMSIIKGNNYEFTNTDKLNVRDEPNGKIILQIPGKKKVVGRALTKGVRVGGYDWNLYAGAGWAGYIADGWSQKTTRAITDINGKDLATPDCSAQEKEILELNKRTNTLTKEIEGLRIELRALEEKNTVITGNLSSALEQAGGLREELGKLEDKYATLVAEKRALVSTNMELARELNELKGQNSIKQVISKFFDWLKAVIKK
jgi:hypothetical protein